MEAFSRHLATDTLRAKHEQMGSGRKPDNTVTQTPPLCPYPALFLRKFQHGFTLEHSSGAPSFDYRRHMPETVRCRAADAADRLQTSTAVPMMKHQPSAQSRLTMVPGVFSILGGRAAARDDRASCSKSAAGSIDRQASCSANVSFTDITEGGMESELRESAADAHRTKEHIAGALTNSSAPGLREKFGGTQTLSPGFEACIHVA